MEKKKDLTTFERQSRERINYLISEFCDGSQQRFSEKTGLNKASVSQYVNGKNTPSNITAGRIASAFMVDPAWLMGFDVPMKPAAVSDPGAPAAVSGSLRKDEKELLSYYNLLDAEDRAEVRGYAKGLVQSEKYRIDSVEGVG